MRRIKKANNKKSFSYKLKAAINQQNLTKLNMSDLTNEKRLKHFQLALSMVGISANLMTCELIHAMAHEVDQKGSEFKLGDAEKIAETIQQKHMAMNQMMPPGMMPPGMMPPKNMPPNLQEMVDKGQIVMGKKVESENGEEFHPE